MLLGMTPCEDKEKENNRRGNMQRDQIFSLGFVKHCHEQKLKKIHTSANYAKVVGNSLKSSKNKRDCQS